MARGIIFDIKRYAIHDGPGIRSTVFFKGCSLRCQWCHNPEGIDKSLEIFLRQEKCPTDCQFCVSACRKNAIKKIKGSIAIDQSRCDLCAECEDVCVYGALEIVGKEVTDAEVMAEIAKDGVFYEESGGGVTFSGGEPFEQPDFLEALLAKSKEKNLHTTVDTCGNFAPDSLDRIRGKVDLFLFDLKMMDDEKHIKYTGQSNTLILENLNQLAANGQQVSVRIPLITGVNDDEGNIEKAAEFLHSLKTIKRVNLLPYHSGGCLKYERLRKKQALVSFRAPTSERIEEIKKIFQAKSLAVKIGG